MGVVDKAGSAGRRLTPAERLRRYASLGVRVGANLQPGQALYVHGHLEHAPLMREIAREAYRAGASFVEVIYRDPHVKKALVDLAPDSALTHVPDWMPVMYEAMPGQAMIGVTGDPEPDLMHDSDQGRLGRARMTRLAEIANRQLEERVLNWCGLGYPNDGWAQAMFGEPDVERLWDIVTYCTRLDEPDPVTAWAVHLERLQDRAEQLNRLKIDALHFQGEGTNLQVGLARSTRWMPALFHTAAGVPFVANLPTEEIFAVPDRHRVDGVVRVTKPVVIANVMVKDLRLVITRGRITEVEAGSGANVVRGQIESDPNAAYLGEIALVDRDSRVGRTNRLFYNPLFDENAACHLAYGDAIWEAVTDPCDPGANRSSVHTDLMIGAPEVSVDALLLSGQRVPLLRDDRWQLS
jgi:aminopeptidase